jgi:hypothetical protein
MPIRIYPMQMRKKWRAMYYHWMERRSTKAPFFLNSVLVFHLS